MKHITVTYVQSSRPLFMFFYFFYFFFLAFSFQLAVQGTELEIANCISPCFR